MSKSPNTVDFESQFLEMEKAPTIPAPVKSVSSVTNAERINSERMEACKVAYETRMLRIEAERKAAASNPLTPSGHREKTTEELSKLSPEALAAEIDGMFGPTPTKTPEPVSEPVLSPLEVKSEKYMTMVGKPKTSRLIASEQPESVSQMHTGKTLATDDEFDALFGKL